MYDPIYSQNIGLCGFRCRVVNKDGTSCTRVVRSYKGIVMHCKRKHGLVAQMKLFETLQENNNGKKLETARKLEPVRVEHDKERGLFYDEHDGESHSED